MKWDLNNNPRVDAENRLKILLARRQKVIKLSSNTLHYGGDGFCTQMSMNTNRKRGKAIIDVINKELTQVMKKLKIKP